MVVLVRRPVPWPLTYPTKSTLAVWQVVCCGAAQRRTPHEVIRVSIRRLAFAQDQGSGVVSFS
jgi:hypothetical protein